MLPDCSGLKNIRIRSQFTPHGTQVARQIVAVPISIMAPVRNDDVGVQYDVAIQQSHTTVEVKGCG